MEFVQINSLTKVIIAFYYRYLLQYRSDDTFDNTYVDDNLRELWRNGKTKLEFPKLTPLRNWEEDEKYQVSNSTKLTKKEVKNVLWRLRETFAFLALTIMLIGIDYSIAKFIDVFRRHGHYGITFTGMSQGLTLESFFKSKESNVATHDLNIQAFDLRTDPCLPRPIYTQQVQMTWLLLVILFCTLSCIFDTFSYRWRSQICNLFYPKRSDSRAINLYQRIRSGRKERRINLELIATREKNRQEKLLRISMVEAIKNWLSRYINKCGKKKITVSCHGCLHVVQANEITLKGYKKDRLGVFNVWVSLCEDCLKDADYSRVRNKCRAMFINL